MGVAETRGSNIMTTMMTNLTPSHSPIRSQCVLSLSKRWITRKRKIGRILIRSRSPLSINTRWTIVIQKTFLGIFQKSKKTYLTILPNKGRMLNRSRLLFKNLKKSLRAMGHTVSFLKLTCQNLLLISQENSHYRNMWHQRQQDRQHGL